MSRWGFVAFAYAVLGVAAALLNALWRHQSVWTTPSPWLELGPGPAREVFSLLLGLAVGGLVVIVTRVMVVRVGFVRRLHQDLRPLAQTMPKMTILLLALLSAFGEELIFRSLLLPWVGLVPQALLFGAVHQVGGSSRWVWMVWALLMGILLGAMFLLTGSLVGPLAAHALINYVNLLYLKHYDPEPTRRNLGGLLDARG